MACLSQLVHGANYFHSFWLTALTAELHTLGQVHMLHGYLIAINNSLVVLAVTISMIDVYCH